MNETTQAGAAASGCMKPGMRHPPAMGLARRLLPSLLLAASLAGPVPAARAAEPPIHLAAEEAMRRGHFAALEEQNARLKQPRSFAPSGASQLDQFRSGVIDVLEEGRQRGEAYSRDMDALTLRWANAHPRSSLAHILHAEALLAHAASIRGRGPARSVPQEAWADVNAYLNHAVAYLEEHAGVAMQDSHAHVVMLKLGRMLQWDRQRLDAIRREGLKRNPDDIILHFEVLRRLLPKWGGNAKVLDEYIRSVTEETRARYGSGFYARLYATALDEQFGQDLFDNSRADWKLMQQAYEDLLARFPGGRGRRNNYAYVACLAADQGTLRRLLREIGPDLDPAQWGPYGQRAMDACREWAGKPG